MRRTARSWIGRVRWIAFVICYSWRGRHFPHPQHCTGRLRGCPCRCGVDSFGSPRNVAIRVRTGPSMPRSSIGKRHRDITNTARIATYARSKRRHSSMQTRVPSSIVTARHTGLTTPKLAVESPFATPRKSRVSPATRAMTTNISVTLSGQRASDPCCVIGCLLCTITHTTSVGQRIIRPALDGRDRLFGHQASIRPCCPPSRMVPRVPRARVDRRSLQPRTSSQTVTPTPSSDSTKQFCQNISSNNSHIGYI